MALLLSVGTILVAPTVVNAYTTTGCKWGSSTITWSDGTSGTNQTSARAAATSWASATDINGMNPTGGQLKVFVSNAGASGYDGHSDWGCIGSALIGANVTLNPYYTNSFSTPKKQAIWVHEFGHGVGLNHSASSNMMLYNCAACVYNSYGYNTPKSDDIAGANAIY